MSDLEKARDEAADKYEKRYTATGVWDTPEQLTTSVRFHMNWAYQNGWDQCLEYLAKNLPRKYKPFSEEYYSVEEIDKLLGRDG